jgi:hypothetical protein
MSHLTRRLAIGLGTGIMLSALAVPAFPQGFLGTIRVEVADDQGATVPGATVTVLNEKTGETRDQVSTSTGTAVFPNLLVGS